MLQLVPILQEIVLVSLLLLSNAESNLNSVITTNKPKAQGILAQSATLRKRKRKIRVICLVFITICIKNKRRNRRVEITNSYFKKYRLLKV